MDLFDELVTEAMFTDGANKDWRDFIKKYENLGDHGKYYVQFTDYANSTDDKRFVGSAAFTKDGREQEPVGPGTYVNGVEIGRYLNRKQKKRITPDKTLWTIPNHSDPLAIYTYPLWYVLQDPSHIPYGKDANFLRVLKIKPGAKVLELQKITSRADAVKLADRAGCFDHLKGDMPDAGERVYRAAASDAHNRQAFSSGDKEPTPAQVYFYMMQHEFSAMRDVSAIISGHMDGWRIGFTNLDSKKQSDRFRKAGIEVVVDNAPEKGVAVVHSNEPVQAFFLSRAAFEIVDVYEISRMKQSYDSYGRHRGEEKTKQGFDFNMVIPRLAATITDRFDDKDKIVSKKVLRGGVDAGHDDQDEFTSVAHGTVFLTKRGRRIEVDGSFTDYDGERRRSVPADFAVAIRGEHGRMDAKWGRDESMNDFVRRFLKEYQSRPLDPNWSPRSGHISKVDQEWRNILGDFTNKLDGLSDTMLKKSSINPRGRMPSGINVKEALRFGDIACDNIQELMAQYGWQWQRPTDPWESLTAWIVADQFFIEANRSRRNDDIKKTATEMANRFLKINELDGYRGESLKSALEAFKGDPEKTKIAKLAFIATGHELPQGYCPAWYNSLIHGMEHLTVKVPGFLRNGYMNFDKSLHHHIGGWRTSDGIMLSEPFMKDNGKFKDPFKTSVDDGSIPGLPPGYTVIPKGDDFTVIDKNDNTFANGMIVGTAKSPEEAKQMAIDHYKETMPEVVFDGPG